MAPFTTSLTTSAVVQNSNAGGKQLVRHTLILKSIIRKHYFSIFIAHCECAHTKHVVKSIGSWSMKILYYVPLHILPSTTGNMTSGGYGNGTKNPLEDQNEEEKKKI